MKTAYAYPKTRIAPRVWSMRTISVLVVETKADLLEALGLAGTQYVSVNGEVGILQSVEREDGSGNCFNVTLLGYGNKTNTVFFRCN